MTASISDFPTRMSTESKPPISPRLAMDGFLPHDLLAGLVEKGRATRAGCLLTTDDGRIYVIEDAVRVLGCSNRETDPYGFTGLVESLGELIRRGFVLSAQAIALNRVAYEVEYGVLAHPLPSADETGVNRRVS